MNDHSATSSATPPATTTAPPGLLESARPSRTAELVTLFRALEASRPAAVRRFDDPLAYEFLSPALRRIVRLARVPGLRTAVPALIDRRWPGPRDCVVTRTVMLDRMTRDAVAAGAEQVVVLGAGLDARPYRIAELEGLPVFEVDHPATQALKRSRLEAAIGEPPASVRFVAIDFDTEDLGERLRDAGWRPELRSLAILEGVVSYLQRDALDATLAWFAGASAPGSRLALTYVDRQILDEYRSGGGDPKWIRAVGRGGEPFKLPLDPGMLEAELAALGYELLEDDSTAAEETRAGLRRPGEGFPAFYRVALAGVR